MPHTLADVQPPEQEAVLSHRASARALRCLREWIDEGVLPDGEPLPSERILAQRLQVNPKTVRNAVNALAGEGLIGLTGKRIRVVRAKRKAATLPLMSNTIAVLTADANSRKRLDKQSGSSLHLTFGAMDKIHSVGKHSLAMNPETLGDSDLKQLIQHRPYGVVALFKRENWSRMKQSVDLCRKAGIPVVIYGDGMELQGYDRVVSDHEYGGYLLTKHLVESGRRRIACLWPTGDGEYWLPRRRQGYLDALAEAGIEPLPLHDQTINVDRLVTSPDPNIDDFNNMARLVAGHLIQYLVCENPVDAIMVASDGLVAPTSAACRMLGKTPNVDVAITGYDDYWMDADYYQFDSSAPFATVDKCNLDIGAEMVQMLVDRVAGNLPSEAQCKLVAPQIAVA